MAMQRAVPVGQGAIAALLGAELDQADPNEPFSTYNNGQLQQVVNYQDYGRTILVGASYKL